jgi:alkylhydroperoxidase family enzyme
MTWVRHAQGSEKLSQILASHSLNREALDGHLALYRTIMFGPSALTRSEREAMAVTVSRANDCHY